MAARTTLFRLNDVQAVRLPREVAFGNAVREVVVVQDGPRRIIAPADASWDNFYESNGSDLGNRQQPAMQRRDSL